jgi:hypothetical protein
MTQEPLEDRIARKFTIVDDGCWEWTDSHRSRGYGALKVGGKRGQMVDAHLITYRTFVGPVPEGLELDHICRNRACINPDHLEPVTRRMNALRGVSIIAAHARKTHCKYGHEFVTVKEGDRTRRRCIPCQYEAIKRYQKRKSLLSERTEGRSAP